MRPRAETLAVLGQCICCKGGSSYGLHPPCPAFLFLFLRVPQPLPPLLPPRSAWVCHQPPANRHQCAVSFSEYTFPIIKTCLSSTPFKSLHCPSLLPNILQHQMCPVHPLLFIPSFLLPKYLAVLYLIPKEPINSAFTWVHPLLVSNASPYFK